MVGVNMKNNSKCLWIIVLILVIVLSPFNVMADEEEVTQPDENVGNTEPVDPGNTDDNTKEEEQTPVIPNPPASDSENQTDNNVSEPEKEDNVQNETIEKEEVEYDSKLDTEKEENKEETTKKEDKKDKKPTNYTTYNPSTTIVDNATKRVEISIVSEKDKSLLSGIKFRIQDKKGNIFYEEETTSEIFVFEEMELGTYYLVQVNSLEGYEENKEKIKFVVSEEAEIVKIEVVNKEKEEPKEEKKQPQLFTGTALLSTVAMFDVALGIGIIVYVRKAKNKIKNKK